MSRPSLALNIEAGLAGWDADIETLFAVLRDGPMPIYQHVGSPGDESDLEATWPAAENDRCVLWVNHSTLGWCLAWSDGAAWHFTPKTAAAVADVAGSPPTAADLGTKLNELLGALRASGVIAP